MPSEFDALPRHCHITICADSPAQVHKLDRLYTWPAAVTLNYTFPPCFTCRHMLSVLASETVNSIVAHSVTINVIILSNSLGDRDTTPAS